MSGRSPRLVLILAATATLSARGARVWAHRSRSNRASAADRSTRCTLHLPDAPEDDALRRAFTAAAGRYRLHPVEVVDVPAPPAPRAPELLRSGVLNTQKIAFGEALHAISTRPPRRWRRPAAPAVDRRVCPIST
jgi:hypothetical protein